MKLPAMLFASATIAFTMTACNQAPPAPAVVPDTRDADVKAIGDLETQWNQDYAAKDLDKIAAHYTDDAILMTPFAEAVNGKDAIRGVLKKMISDPALALTFKASKIDVAKSGDLGYTQGSYTLKVTDPATHKPVTDHGSYVTTYRKQADGSWKAVGDIASTAVSPQPPPKHK
jgi:uncharacterized protein (TIGR02246 family)